MLPVSQLQALKAELTTNPQNIVSAPSATFPTGQTLQDIYTEGNDNLAAALLNATTGAGAGTIPVQSMPCDDFMTAILPIFSALMASGNATMIAKYQPWIALMQSANNVNIQAIASELAMLVADNLATQAAINTLTTRACSRAETLLGYGTVLSHSDIGNTRGV